MDEQAERDFADEFLAEQRDLFDQIAERTSAFVSEGRADKLYLLVKAINTLFVLANCAMHERLTELEKAQWQETCH